MKREENKANEALASLAICSAVMAAASAALQYGGPSQHIEGALFIEA